MARAAQPTPPLACYGVENDRQDKRCQACPHFHPCATASGVRARYVPLNRARFELAGVPGLTAADPGAEDFKATYESCYRQVFKAEPDRCDRYPAAGAKVTEAAAAQRCQVRLFITTAMMGHQLGNPDRRYYANMLLGDSASKTVERYRQAAAHKYGVFDLPSLLRLLGTEGDDVESSLLGAELLVGRWIVAYKRRAEGSPLDGLYGERELGLDPRWLAVEPTYAQWLSGGQAPLTGELRSHRHRVSQVEAGERIVLLRMRSDLMPKAVAQVLEHADAKAEFFLVESPITNSVVLWNKLGLALQRKTALTILAGHG